MVIYKYLRKPAEIFGIPYIWMVGGFTIIFFLITILTQFLQFKGLIISIICGAVLIVIMRFLNTVDWISVIGKYRKTIPQRLTAIPEVYITLEEIRGDRENRKNNIASQNSSTISTKNKEKRKG